MELHSGHPPAAEGAGTAGLGGHLEWGSGLGCGRGHWAGGTWRQTGLAEALAGPWPVVITGRAGLASGILGHQRASVTLGRTEAQRAGGPGHASVETGVPILGAGPVGDRLPSPDQEGRWRRWLESVPGGTREGLGSRRHCVTASPALRVMAGQGAAVLFSWCFSRCYENGRFLVHL